MPDDASAPQPERDEVGLVAAWLRQKADSEGSAARAKAWAEENAEAIAAYNERIEREGCFGEAWRRW